MENNKIFKLFIISVMSIFIFTACSNETANDSFNKYTKAWENKNYENMYDMLSQTSKEYINKEDFVNRYKNIYEGIGVKDIGVNLKDDKDDKKDIQFSLRIDTLAGEVVMDDYKATMVKEKQDKKKEWFIDWNESLIFPQMEKEDKVILKFLDAKRGEIYDKNGNGLAVNGKRNNIGIHPAKYNKSSNKDLAILLDIDEKIINDKLEKNTNLEDFVPIVKISIGDKVMLEKLLEIEGIISQEVNERVYPGGEALGSLIGYIKPITAEELEKDQEDIYNNRSLVGKLGLETVFEDILRAKDGRELYISKIQEEKEVEKIILSRIEGEDGKNINTTIDTELQKKIYSEIDGDIGTSTAIDPNTGEILAMVSSPSFDSNLYTTYITDTQKKTWENMDASPFENRINKAYSPGSTFKLITSAIGLKKGFIDPSEKLSIQGKAWQRDSSWGNYKINRVSQKLSSVNFNDAMIYSDNIYFARTALKIEEENFLEESKLFGFGEKLPINYPFAKSQIVNNDKFESEILLADTGYGQGQVLMSPLHISLVYSMLVNNRNIMEPTLEQGDSPKIWKENVITEENKNIILNSLINVIENKNGTGYEARLPNIKLAGKTGTAELKLTQDSKGKENGCFVAMDVNDPKIVISMMIEDLGDKGGSHYVVPKVKNVMEYYLTYK